MAKCREESIDIDSLLATGGGMALSGYASVYPAGDVNGDGIADFFYGQRVVFGGMHLKALSEEELSLHGYALVGFAGLTVSAGDVNGDGLDDAIHILYPDAHVIFGKVDTVSVFRADVQLGMGGAAITGVQNAPSRVSARDLNGDGFEDLVLGGSESMQVVPGRATWASVELATAGSLLDFPPSGHVAAGDLDGDGTLDLVYCLEGWVRVVGAPDGWDQGQRLTYSTEVGCGGSPLIVEDFDKDGADDLLSAEIFFIGEAVEYGVSLVYGPLVLGGEGDDQVVADVYSMQKHPPTIADVSGDGTAEIVESFFSDPPGVYSSAVGPFSAWPRGGPCPGAWSPLLESLPISRNIGDVTGDGRDDLFVTTMLASPRLIIFDVCD